MNSAGCLAVEVAHRQRQPAQVGERIVGGQHAVQVGRSRQHRRLGAAQLLGVGVDALRNLAPVLRIGAVAVLHALQVGLGQCGVAVPRVGTQHLAAQAAAVVALRAGEDAGARVAIRRLVVQPLRLQPCAHRRGVAGDGVVAALGGLGQRQRLVEPLHHHRELVAVQAGGRQHHVHAGTTEFGGRNQFDATDAAALVPHRPHAQRGEHLRLEDAVVAHGLHAPQRERQLLRRLAVFGAVRLQQLINAACPACQAARDGTRIGSKPYRLRPVGRLSGVRSGSPPRPGAL